MASLFKNLKGDKAIWVFIGILALISFMPIYSASSNLAYTAHGSSTFSYMSKHFIHIILGLLIMFFVHKIPYNYFRGLSMLGMIGVAILLVFTLATGTTIQGANASRWIKLPFVGLSFQPSALPAGIVYVYTAHYLAKYRGQVQKFTHSLLRLWIPVGLIVGLILPANFSTAALIFMMVMMLSFIGGYPKRYLAAILGVGFLFLGLFILTAKALPNLIPNRVDTWIKRIDNFATGGETSDDTYQVELARQAIASGKLTGMGPGKSVQKNFLPQSSSDFIFAIIIEELGLLGATGIMIIYLVLLFRIVVIAQKSDSLFGTLVVIGVGFPIITQALINMAVAVQILPVTGQTLPFLSSGGSSIWMICLAFGIILSVSANRQEEKENTESIDSENEINPLEVLSETI